MELYHVLQEKNVSLSESQKQSFLELLAYHEDAETLDEDAHLSLGVKKIKKTTMAKSVWPNCELFEAVYESIESKTPEARLALLMGYCKFGQYSKANAALESVREARDPWTTDTFNCLILCTSTKFFTHRANLYKFLQNMRAQKCSPTYETLNIITRRILSLKDSSNLPVLFSTWAEFKAAKVPLPLHAYDFLIKFLRSSNIRGDALKVIISEILDEVKGKDWTQGVRHPEDYLFFDSFITVALEQDKNLELAYKFHHEFTLFGNNQRFLDHFGVSCYYYTTLLTIILAVSTLSGS